MLLQVLVFMLIASPMMFKFVRGILGGWVSNAEGRASWPGLFVHALVFVFLAGFLSRAVSKYEAADLGSEDKMESSAPAPAPMEAVPRDYSNLFDSILGETGMNNFDH